MKLWMVLYVAGKVGGSWGPLPYDMPECLVRAGELRQDVDTKFDTGITKPDAREGFEKLGVRAASDITFACEVHQGRPETDKFGAKG